jgi:beta-lactamase class A
MAGLVRALAHEAGLATPSVVVRRVGPAAGSSHSSQRATGTARRVEAMLDPDLELTPASMIKTPLAAALVDLWAAGEVDPAAAATVSAGNMTANDADSPLQPGYVTRIDELATLMLTRSDNVATNMLIDIVGRARANRFLRRIGLDATAIRRKVSGRLPLIDDPEAAGRNAHPARDAARLFELIAERALAGAEWLYAALLAQEWNDKLSRGLAAGDRFAHKTGDTDEVSHDGGILDTAQGACYVIVVYTSLASSAAADARLADFMRALRAAL